MDEQESSKDHTGKGNVMRLIHISDLHIRKNNKDNTVVKNKLSEIYKMMENGDVLVITGDITDDGNSVQYENAYELLHPFKGRIVIVPGNHDFGKWGSFYNSDCVKRFAKLREKLCSTTNYMLCVNNILKGQILYVDSCLRTGSVIDFAQGKVGWWQRWRLKSKLIEMKKHNMLSVVAIHHSPYYSNRFCRLQDSKEFLETVLGFANCVLMGHEHMERKIWYPKEIPIDMAQTRLYAAGAFFREDTNPIIIDLHSN